MDTKNCETEFIEVIKKDFDLHWNFEVLESWLKNAKIEENTKRLIKMNTELLKKHI